MSVHYKFKNTLHYDAIKFDGVYITTADLKNIIIQQKKLVKGDSDLKITNEETGNSYTDDQLIPKNTSLIISRVPFAQPNKRARIGDSRTSNSASQSSSLSNIRSGIVGSSSGNASTNNNSSNGSAGPYHSSNRHHHSLSRGHHPYRYNNHRAPYNNNSHHNSANNNNSNDTLETSNHLSTKPSELMTEEERMRQVQSQSTQDFDPSRYARGGRGGHNHHVNYPVPHNYTCHRCGLPGHHIRNCTSNFNHKVKLSSGIPRSFMIPSSADVKGAMMTPSGEYAVPYIDHEAYKDPKKEKAPFFDENEDNDNGASRTKPEVPEDYKCGICQELLNDAVFITCCKEKFCDECIRTKLIESEMHECPACHTQGISPDSLISSSFWRQAVANYNGYDASTKVEDCEDTLLDQFAKFLESRTNQTMA